MTSTTSDLRRYRRRTGLLAVSLSVPLVAGFAVACAGGSAPTSGATITLYNAQHQQTTSALIAAFTHQTGINVRVDNDDEDVLTAEIEQEGSRSPADVTYTENSNWLQQLHDRTFGPS
jgi:iron(III) transport system substrate-binding protein